MMGANAIIGGYSRIPIYTYMSATISPFDNIDTKSCGYVKQANDVRWGNTTYGDLIAFPDVMYLRDELRDKYAKIMNLNETQKNAMTFKDAYLYADLVFSQKFELIKSKKVEWTDQDILYVNRTQKYGLTRPLSDEARSNFTRKLHVSKVVKTPLDQIAWWCEQAVKAAPSDPAPQYWMYSGHD
jgi:hypothetical protein